MLIKSAAQQRSKHQRSKQVNMMMIIITFVVAGSIVLPASAFIFPHHSLHVHQHYQHQHLVHNRAAAAPEHGLNTKLNLFGLGNDDTTDKDDPEKELARFSNLLVGDTNNIDTKLDSLSIMISSWSQMFSDHKKMGLTTAVDIKELPNTADSAGVQLIFKKGTGGRSAYYDKDQDDKENKDSKKREDSIKNGGVQILINKVSDGADLDVIASRCEIEEGTMIKEMSEQTIIDSLGQAMQAWKKEQQ